METLEEKIQNIKFKADQIRTLHGEGVKFRWPKDFRSEVIVLVKAGVPRRTVAERIKAHEWRCKWCP